MNATDFYKMNATDFYKMNATDFYKMNATDSYKMNASNIFNTVAVTLAFYGVNVTSVLSIIAKVVFSTVLGFVLKTVLEQAIKRYSKRNRSQLNQFNSDVKVFQEILQETEKSVIGTDDNYVRQLLEKIKKNLDKCQKVCDQIESQSLAGTFHRSSQQVEELDLLLRNSIHVTNTYLSASSAGMKTDVKHLRAVVNNLQAGMCQLHVHAAHTEPKKVKKLIVEELRPGILHTSWKETTETDYYEVQYDRQTGHSIKVTTTQCLLDSMQLHFPSKKFYNIHVRGVNGCGPGEWSESTVGHFTILPEQPRKPLAVHFNSSASIVLVMEKPVKRDGAKPVTHFVVEHHTDADKRCVKKVFSVNNLEALTFEGKEAVKINLNNRHANTALIYHVLISHRNEDGDSLPCVDCIETDRITPDVPVGLKVAYRATCGILIKWKKTNACIVDHYEVHWEINKHNVVVEVTKNCYAVKQSLDSDKSYLIKVRAVNKRSKKSEFTEVRAKTKSNVSILMILIVLIAIDREAHRYKYMPVFQLLGVAVGMIVVFLFTPIKNLQLAAPILIGNSIFAAFLDLLYPVNFLFIHAHIILLGYALYSFNYMDMQLVQYMLEKCIVSTLAKKQIKKQTTQQYLLTSFLLFIASTMILFCVLHCFIYFKLPNFDSIVTRLLIFFLDFFYKYMY